MDKLRALTYFLAAANERSLSAAARRLNVTTPAVARLVSALEESLEVTLFERTARGLRLTAEGARYRDACIPALRLLAAADDDVSGAGSRASGTLIVGAPSYLSQHCLLPALPAFRSRFPDIQIDLRTVDRAGSAEASRAEVLVLYGWPEAPDMVRRRIAQTRMLVCASPDYWAANGMPARPSELETHECLVFRDQEGTALDAWQYQRGDEAETATVRGWLASSHRDDILDAVLRGLGVGRFSDLSVQPYLRSGRLVPALAGWESKDSPPINVLYRASHRRLPRVRAFVDFAVELFRQLEAEREPRFAERVPAERPRWYRRRSGRASASFASARA